MCQIALWWPGTVCLTAHAGTDSSHAWQKLFSEFDFFELYENVLHSSLFWVETDMKTV